MDVLKRMEQSVIVPVVVLDREEDAVPTAKALAAGGVDVMEITFRTDAAPEAIKAVCANCPDVVVGAGTVLNLEQCRLAVRMGAKFIVSPGHDAAVTEWCVSNGIPITPGCVTPTEIQEALRMGLRVIKFFPANVYGGLQAMRALAGPFPGVKFLPTGGVNTENIREYVRTPFIHAVGGSWICPRSDIQNKNFEKITQLCIEARKAALER